MERVDGGHKTWPAVRVYADRSEGVGKCRVSGEISNDGDNIWMFEKQKFAIAVVIGKGTERFCA
jgi:hypothetical protein